ncbi:MAG: hypothetical protein DRQ01_07885, partial [Ignavibacteriae bacterium]
LLTHGFYKLRKNYMSNIRTHPQPHLLKREGAKTSTFLSFLKIPLLVREGFRVSLLLFPQAV